MKEEEYRDFFEDIINGIVEMENPEVMKDFYNRRVVSQFHEIVPEVLEELGREPIISFGRPSGLEKGIKIPDFTLTDYFIKIILLLGGLEFDISVVNVHVPNSA